VAANEYVGPTDEMATTVSSNRLSSLARSVAEPLAPPPTPTLAGGAELAITDCSLRATIPSVADSWVNGPHAICVISLGSARAD